eukprot:TRINITY_DN787_c1_g1_i1.p1 TRINITY_DN787_c1_g1~~TRINITY_DN787_c1_g1_i1.p1  ORF type:complete len:761 (-),score=124.31 TRINITY_DN787_c1_g1_i1:14-2062(-)
MKPSRVDGLLGVLPGSQMVNHFRGSGNLDSKSALKGHLEACPACSSAIFPRQYDLCSGTALAAFIDDYILTSAEGVLCAVQEPGDSSGATEPSAEAVQVALRVLARAKALKSGTGDAEARLLRCRHEWKALLGKGHHLPQSLEARLRPFLERYEAHGEAPCSQCSDDAGDCSAGGVASGAGGVWLCPDASLRCRQQGFISKSGRGCAWVVKAPHAARGEGVTVHCDLQQLLSDAAGRKARGQHWNCAVQKYIEQPLTLPPESCKTDLRLWVLVLSWNPCVVFVHAGPYFRVAGQPFGFAPTGRGKAPGLERTAHLTNRPQQERENRLLLEDFLERLEAGRPGSTEQFWNTTWPCMLDGVRLAVLATQAAVVTDSEEYRRSRKTPLPGPRCFELFGFDFALDADLKPWLLEANVTPDMLPDEPEPIKSWARDATEGLLKIVTRSQSGELRMPAPADLATEPEGVAAARLLEPDGSDAGHSEFCLRRRVNRIPPRLVSGFEIEDCSPWRLVLAEEPELERSLACRHSTLSSRHWGERLLSGKAQSHDQVLRHRLLPFAPEAPAAKEKTSQVSLLGPWSSKISGSLGQLQSARSSPKARKSLSQRSRSLACLGRCDSDLSAVQPKPQLAPLARIKRAVVLPSATLSPLISPCSQQSPSSVPGMLEPPSPTYLPRVSGLTAARGSA